MKAVCLASGPSLTVEDVEAVRQWRQGAEDRLVVVANSTFRAAPWADALFAMDTQWWMRHREEVDRVFRGAKYTTSSIWLTVGATKLPKPFKHFFNSGAAAISLAERLGATRIALLGYDCQHAPDGRTHWHGSHPDGLGDAATIKRWPERFEQLAKTLRVPVVNCSRQTALKCFERGDIETFLLS